MKINLDLIIAILHHRVPKSKDNLGFNWYSPYWVRHYMAKYALEELLREGIAEIVDDYRYVSIVTPEGYRYITCKRTTEGQEDILLRYQQMILLLR